MSFRPRILLLSTSYLPLVGGSELAIQHTTDRLPDWDFDMVTARHRADAPVAEQVGRVRVFRAGGRWGRWSLVLPKVLLPLAITVTALRLMRSHRYVAVHVYQASQAGGAGYLVKRFHPRVPLIVTLQEGKDLDRQPWAVRFLRGIIVRRADVVTAISGYLAAYALRLGARRVVTVPNGVDVDLLSAEGTHPAGHRAISVSRLVPKNGLENLLRAMPRVLAAVPDAHLSIVGEGPLEPHLRRSMAELGITGAVSFTGAVPHEDLARVLHGADVFVRPSLSEGLGTAFLEAMAAGVVVVGSNVGGIADFLQHGETGLVCDPRNPEDIAAKIVEALVDAPLRARLSENALAMVRRRYDWRAVARQMGEVYSEVAV